MQAFPAADRERQAWCQTLYIAVARKSAVAAIGWAQAHAHAAAAVPTASAFAGKGAQRIPMAITSETAVMANSRPCFKADALSLIRQFQFEAHIGIGRYRRT